MTFLGQGSGPVGETSDGAGQQVDVTVNIGRDITYIYTYDAHGSLRSKKSGTAWTCSVEQGQPWDERQLNRVGVASWVVPSDDLNLLRPAQLDENVSRRKGH